MISLEKIQLSKSTVFQFLPKEKGNGKIAKARVKILQNLEKYFFGSNSIEKTERAEKALAKIFLKYGIAEKQARKLLKSCKRQQYSEYAEIAFKGMRLAVDYALSNVENIELKEELAFKCFKKLNEIESIEHAEEIIQDIVNRKFYKCENIDLNFEISAKIRASFEYLLEKEATGYCTKSVEELIG